MADGTAEVIAAPKREEAKERRRIAATCLAGWADARASHFWLTLAEYWRSAAFVAAAARPGVGLTTFERFRGRARRRAERGAPGPGVAVLAAVARGLAASRQAARFEARRPRSHRIAKMAACISGAAAR